MRGFEPWLDALPMQFLAGRRTDLPFVGAHSLAQRLLALGGLVIGIEVPRKREDNHAESDAAILEDLALVLSRILDGVTDLLDKLIVF